jgi:transcription elongation factor
MTYLRPSDFGAASAAHLAAIVEHGFTERQARFLALVMRHSGVCVPRQYAQVAASPRAPNATRSSTGSCGEDTPAPSSASTTAHGST